MNGFKTVITNTVLLAASALSMAGVDIGLDEQAAIVTAVITIGNLILRAFTKGPVFEK